MKRILNHFGLCLAFVLSLYSSLNAQTFIDGSFTGSFPPSNWLRYQAVDGSNSWSVYWGGGQDNGNYAYVGGKTTGVANDAWLVLPQLHPQDSYINLSFYVKKGDADDVYDQSELQVLVSENGFGMENFTKVLATYRNTVEQNDFTSLWTEKVVDLSDYIGKDISIAFRVVNNSVQISIDQISGIMLSSFDKDIRINSLSLNPSRILFAGNQVDLSVILENRGLLDAESSLSFTIDGVQQQTLPVSVDSGMFDTVVFSHKFVQSGDFKLGFNLEKDDNVWNDTLSQALTIYKENTLVEDFHYDYSFPPAEWNTYQVNSPSGIQTYLSGANDSRGAIVFNNDWQATEKSISERTLITPQIRPEAGNVLTFWAKAGSINTNPEKFHFAVLLSESGSDVADFTDTLQVLSLGAEDAQIGTSWKQYSVDLSAYAGKDVFVAFYLKLSASVTALYIDEVGGEIPLASFGKDIRVLETSLYDPNRYWFEGESVNLWSVLDNYGSQDVSDCKVSFLVDGQEVDFKMVDLLSGEVSDTLGFSWTIPHDGVFDLSVSVGDDENNINNKKSVDLTAYAENYFIEGFEGIESKNFPPKYWAADQTTWGSTGWSLVGSYSSYKGESAAQSMVDCKLITPMLSISSDDSLCFYVKTTWASAVYAILSSEDAITWDTLLIDTIGSADGWQWQKFFFDKQDAGWYGNRYIALLTLQNNMVIDEIQGAYLVVRNDQFSLLSGIVEPGTVCVAGEESFFQAVVYNDGLQSGSREVSLWLGETLLDVATTRELAPGEYDTLHLSYIFDEPILNGSFRFTLPNDIYPFDNTQELVSHIYPSGLWRLEEGFEDFASSFWAVGDRYWTAEKSGTLIQPATGDYFFQRSFSMTTRSIAVSPYFDLPFEEYEVSVDIYRTATNDQRPDKVEFAFGATPEWEDVIFVDSVNRLPSAYPEGNVGWDTYVFRVNLSDLEKGFFMIREIGHLNQYGSASYEKMAFDNLVIRPVFDNDVEIAAISSPLDTVWGADSVKMALSVVLRNNGEESLTGSVIRYGVDDKELGILEWEGNLSAGEDTLLVVSDHLSIPYASQFDLYVEANLEGDPNQLNDRVEKSVSVKKAYDLPFVQDFEDLSWDKDWMNFSFSTDNGGKSWFVDTTGDIITAPFGKACANSSSLDDDLGAVHPDNWLITPGLHIRYPKAYLSYYVQAADVNYFAETYEVLVSTLSNRDTSFFLPIYTDTLDSDELKKVVLPLDGFEGEVVYIAFRHYNCTDQYRLLLDSIYVYDPETYEIRVEVNPQEAGSVSGSGSYILGQEVVLEASATEAYLFDGWYLEDETEPISVQNPYIFDCDGEMLLEARFLIKEFPIVLQAGEGGKVEPADTVMLKYGEDLEVKVIPDEGYDILDVEVDGTSVGAVATYRFEEVKEGHVLKASFSEQVSVEENPGFRLSFGPNPFRDELQVNSSLPLRVLRMLDLQGREVWSMGFQGEANVVCRPHVPCGFYLMQAISVDGRVSVERVVKIM